MVATARIAPPHISLSMGTFVLMCNRIFFILLPEQWVGAFSQSAPSRGRCGPNLIMVFWAHTNSRLKRHNWSVQPFLQSVITVIVNNRQFQNVLIII